MKPARDPDIGPPTDCSAIDRLYGGSGKPPAPPTHATRVDFSKATRGELLCKTRAARELFEDFERAYLAVNSGSTAIRLQMIGEAVSALAEIERRMQTPKTKRG